MKKETCLIFTGDIGFDKYMDRKWEDEDLVSEEILEYLHDADHLIVNVEGPLSDGKKKDSAVAGLTHSMDPRAADFLKRIGADVWNICNNHIMDAGETGMKDTLEVAKEYGALTLGAGMNIAEAKAPLFLDEAGGIGMIGAGYQRACRKASEDKAGCLSWSDMDIIKEQIDLIREKCRWCIVVAHGGEEFTALPSPYTRDRYHEYLEMWADIVVAHHPHVPMNYETVGDKVIFYSLGNFIFDTDYQRSQFNTQYGLFIKLRFTKDSFVWEPYGILIDRESERVIRGDIPGIFTDVNEEEYRRLIPLAAKMFIANTRRQLKYLYPDKFSHATEQDFIDNFYEPLRSGRVPGEILDMQIIYPLSLKADEGEWKKSSLSEVIEFMLEQMQEE